jgi:hypothetical protein
MNRKGQFSIIAALLVAIVLVGAVVATYSAIRYSGVQEQPQILSVTDETNIAVKEILGFTVGYYGSVLKVTGNQTYAQELATNYLEGGLKNAGAVNPEWGLSINVTNLQLGASWFSNRSYSEGNATVTYDLKGLGMTGIRYSASTRLEVQILQANSTSQAQLTILKDAGEPQINLGKSNLKFHSYDYETSTWGLAEPNNVTSYADGSYLIDLPQGVLGSSYAIQVEDNRGLMVIASSFSRYTSTLTWNTTSFQPGLDYVDTANLNVTGAHSNFTAQQYGPDGVYDTLAEAANGTTYQPSYPTSSNLLGTTTVAGGNLTSLQNNDGHYMGFNSFASSYGGSATFGTQTKGYLSSYFSYVRGSRYSTGASSGRATSISAYLSYTSSSNTLGNTIIGLSGHSIMDTMRGQRFTTTSTVAAQSISAYISCSTSAKNMKAAIYDSSGNLVSSTEEKSVATGTSWQTFNFASPPILTASTQYVLVVWSSSGSGTADLRYSSTSDGNGRTASQTYGTWPSPQSFSTNSYQYSIYCNYLSTFNAQAAIYSGDGGTLIAATEEKTLSTVNDWVTFNFINQPTLAASTYYVLAAECSDTLNVAFYYYDFTGDYYRGSSSYPNWPPLSDQGSRAYSIYCTYASANQYTAQVELTGSSTNPLSWNDLVWTIDSSASTSGVTATFQLYNAVTGLYPTSGDGFMTATLNIGDQTTPQTIVTNPSNFVNSSGYWKINITAVKSTSTPFALNLDLVQYSPDATNYALDLEEQLLNVNATNLRQDLCIKTGTTTSSEPLVVQVLHDGSWQNLTLLVPNYFNNVSLAPYIDSTTLTIRFVGSNDATDPTQDTWNIDSVYIKDEPDISFLLNLQESTFTLEVLQNGTMRWLGQNMQVTTETIPFPPVPVKSIHVNETINGVNQEVPFQIEDWASNYQIPLGLTSNTTVFSNRQMIVFLLNSKVADFTIWWDGSDSATQTPLAFINNYFTFNPGARTLSNSKLQLKFSTTGFNYTSTVGSVTSSAAFMRFNGKEDNTDPELSYPISNGVVRDIILGEAEFSNGITNCSNTYTNIVVTLPANVPYYTYQTRIMFLDSTPRPRNISDLCPVRVSTSVSPTQTQTENGTFAGFPIVQNDTATFPNLDGGSWTAHHFSQFISSNGKGVGIMFTDGANQRLYAFDSFSGSNSKGALKTSSALIELLPVSQSMVQFTYAYDITWIGAIATWDGTTPMCSFYDGTTPMGLWILAEYPPTLTVTAKS